MRLFLLEEKNWSVLSVAGASDESVIVDYIERANDKAAIGLLGYFDRFAELGHTGFSSSQLHEVDKKESIYQFSKGKHRVLFFNVDGKAIIVSCPHLKKGAKVDPSEVKQAIKVKKEYLQARKSQKITLVRE